MVSPFFDNCQNINKSKDKNNTLHMRSGQPLTKETSYGITCRRVIGQAKIMTTKSAIRLFFHFGEATDLYSL